MKIKKMHMLLVMLMILSVTAGCFNSPVDDNGNGNGNSEALEQFNRTIFVMDTIVTVQIFSHKDEDHVQGVFDALEEEMERLESILSAHRPESDVGKIDAAAGKEAVNVQPETMEVIQKALEYAELTLNTFDITLAPVLRLYNFPEEIRPTRQQLEANLPLVNWRDVVVDQEAGTVFLAREGMKIDLGGIAKGYIVDRSADLMEEMGIEYGVVNAGGDIRVLGPKPDGTAWRVGIKDPLRHQTDLFAIVEINTGSIVTSGDYERYFIQDDTRYHHIIDPATGLPASSLHSVTIVAPTADLADLLSTAVFVMGLEDGLDLINRLDGIDALVWDANHDVHWSDGFDNFPEESDRVDYYIRQTN